jgi:VCBS repeat-containing protein
VSETFSSDGPSRSFFSPNGTPLTPGNFSSPGGLVRNGVDITAADGATTTTPGFIPFFGTSAAAPNAAALAVLALVLDPTLSPDALEGAMKATAIDIETPGIDVTTGSGIVMAPALLAEVEPDPNTPPTAVGDDYETAFETQLTVAAPGVLGNDSDAELDPLTATLGDDVDHGTLSLAPDGSFSYTPADDFSGQDSFTYTASDGTTSSTPATVTITVAPRVVLAGTATGPTSEPLPLTTVLAFAPGDLFVPTAFATTGPDGTYTFSTELPAGSYAPLFVPPGGSGLVPQWHGGTTRTDATTVAIPADGPPVTGVDEQFIAPATAAGTVLGPDGNPAANVTVRAYLAGMSLYFPSATTTTAADGTYTLGPLAPGTYEIVFMPPGTTAFSKWYGGDTSRTSAAPVVLTADTDTTGLDAQLDPASSISGDAGGSGYTIVAFKSTDIFVGTYQTTSAPDGSYSLAQLPSGTYKVAFFPPAGGPTW